MKAPNILFLFTDQHAQSVAGCYGDTVVQTPHLDRLAREGVVFDNAYCPSPICTPSRMSMLTSRWPHRQDVWTNDDCLRSDLPTWAHRAGEIGYRPVLVGRMHSIGPDQMHGYAERLVGDHSPNFPGAKETGLGLLSGTSAPERVSLEKAGSGVAAYQIKDSDATEAAVSWLRGSGARSIAEGRPFCLTVGLMLPHPPYVVDQAAFDLYFGRVPSPRIGSDHTSHDWHRRWRRERGIENVSDEEVARARAAYWGLVHRTDENIGRILDALATIGAMDDTLIVYASDHGDHLGERGLWWKHTFYEESAKVPLIMRLPGTLPKGERRDQIVNLIDVSQTLIEAMGGAPLPQADGRSLWRVAQSNNASWVNETYCEYCTDGVPSWTGGWPVQQRMLRSGDWKLCLYDTEEPQLFNLAEDPDELVNLAGKPEHKEIEARLTAQLTRDWNPQDIATRMLARRVEKDILQGWAKQVQPESSHIWSHDPALNRLD